ncbi:MAG: sulfatase family protein [Bythopirellula sp.]
MMLRFYVGNQSRAQFTHSSYHLLEAAALWLIISSAISMANSAPNVVVLLADDLGYGDLGCYGHRHINTPHLDQLAEQSLRFTACYSAAPMCSPARAGLLTGRSPHRMGIYDWIAHDGTSKIHLQSKEITFAQLMQQAGYQTALHGKWHLNSEFNTDTQPQPDDHGFDYWYATQFSPSHLNPTGFVRNGESLPPQQGYACQVVVDDAIDWIREARDPAHPFLQFIAFHEPHHPVASPPELVARYLSTATENEKEAIYFANVENLDLAIGRYLSALEDLGLAQNTLLIFTSDHGPQTRGPGVFRHSYGSAGPFRGRKRQLWEGGLRVPLLIRWPAQIRGARVIEPAVGFVDVLPTLANHCDFETPTDRAIDGCDISPLLKNGALDRQAPLHWHFYSPLTGPQSTIRVGPWVLTASWDVGAKPFAKGTRHIPKFEHLIHQSQLRDFQLYDVENDPHQDQDVSGQRPDVVARLSSQLIELHAAVRDEAPHWNIAQ